MRKTASRIALVAALGLGSAPAMAEEIAFDSGVRRASPAAELPPYLQCVPYARQVSGIGIYGDAYTWWDQAAGRYSRGRAPRVGAVLAFKPHRNMRLGHVAAVSQVIDSRRVLLRHANWSPINGRRGQIENDVLALDVSEANDWSMVRVWYAPIGDLGTTEWPVHGFIYPDAEGRPQAQWAAAEQTVRPAPPPPPPPVRPSRTFVAGFSGF